MSDASLRDELRDHPELARALIGVVDLRAGKAVHAVAGQRQRYAPVQLRDGTDCSDPVELISHYQSLGIRRFYFADLDSIIDDRPQKELMQSLLGEVEYGEKLVDIGWRDSNRSDFAESLVRAGASLVAATETASSPESLHVLCQQVGASSVVLGLDYHDGQFIGGKHSADDWIQVAIQCDVNLFLPLDIATVGTSDVTSTMGLCRQLIDVVPTATIYSGGGIKNNLDVMKLQAAGCRGCLVATALL